MSYLAHATTPSPLFSAQALSSTEESTRPRCCRTPLLRTDPRCFFKLENFNSGGSHKARAARWMVEQAIASGSLTPHSGQTIIEKTGGNLGVGLAIEARRLGFDLELAVGMSFSPLKRRVLQLYGAHLIGIEMLQEGAQPAEVIHWHLEQAEQLGKRYYFIDQFNNPANVEAHYRETGPEIIAQLTANSELGGRPVVLVGGVGSGASLSGIGRALKETFKQVEVIGVQPAGCDILQEIFIDHNLQGIAVGVKPASFDESLVDRFLHCTEADAYSAQRTWTRRHGIFPGNSSGANIWAVEQLASDPAYHDAVIVSLIYDNGEAYVDPH